MVEILSDSSVGKDTERLPPRCAVAGVGELWLIDARTSELRFDVKIAPENGLPCLAPLEELEKYEINPSRTMLVWDPARCAINDELSIADYLNPGRSR